MSYEYKTKEAIRNDILDTIPKEYEKSPGNLTFDIPSAVALSLSKFYQNLKTLVSKQDIDNLSGDELAKFVMQRKGIIKKEATYASGILSIIGNGNINIGDIFETESGTEFEAIAFSNVSGSKNVKIKAIKSGISGNVGANSIRFMPVTLDGIVSVNNEDATMDGFNEESDNSLRERYYEALKRPATSGNIYHYLLWAKEIAGVGDAKVIPLWNGQNTVKLIIIDDLKLPASPSLIEKIQESIDPKGEEIDNKFTLWGTGSGKAPIGAYCTVESARKLDVSIECDVSHEEGISLEIIKTRISDNITSYFRDIAFEQDYISYAKIGSIILNTSGVKDYNLLKVNENQANIDVANDQVPVLETLNVL